MPGVLNGLPLSPLYAGSQLDSSKPSRILFVEEVTELVKENLPDLWNLGYLYLSKSLYAVSGGAGIT